MIALYRLVTLGLILGLWWLAARALYRRRVFITLSDGAAEAVARYFAELGRSAAQLV